jgi:hypothetical protein
MLFVCAGADSAPVHAHEGHGGQFYRCADGRTGLKVVHCSNGNPALCDIELYKDGAAQSDVRLASSNVNDLIRECIGGEVAQQGSPTLHSGGTAHGADRNGFRIGETVNAATAGSWYPATILRADGNSYLVRPGPAVEVWKLYPTELRRIGPLTEVDKAYGLFALHEKVRVKVEGDWVEGEIIMERGMEYQIAWVGNHTAWASAKEMRRVAGTEKPPAPPQSDVTSCAGKIEGQYSSADVGSFTIVFRSGKAIMKRYGGADDDERECWISGSNKKLLLRKPGTDEVLPIEINDDGTLDAPTGVLRKKSSGARNQ